MDLSPQQDEGIRAVDAWLKADGGPQVFYLAGFAGTGKTTLAKRLSQDYDTRFCAYTGKAASVMRSKGCEGASTIHQLIYIPAGRSKEQVRELESALAELRHEIAAEGGDPDKHPKVGALLRDLEMARQAASQPSFKLNFESQLREADLAVIDECSMVDGKVGEDLLSFGTKLLVLGDPAQLPPVFGTGFFTEREPDFMLTEVHRQAAESPVLRLATAVRQGERLEYGDYGTSQVVSRAQLDRARVVNADQVLVGKNATRRQYNVRLRQIAGIESPLPIGNDRLVCLRNDHKLGVLNGTIWLVNSTGVHDDEDVELDIRSDDEPDKSSVRVTACTHHFMDREGRPDWFSLDGRVEMDYGYALTVHKAQGSQWSDVCLFDESGVFRQDRHRWLYTGITRAADRITIVR